MKIGTLVDQAGLERECTWDGPGWSLCVDGEPIECTPGDLAEAIRMAAASWPDSADWVEKLAVVSVVLMLLACSNPMAGA